MTKRIARDESGKNCTKCLVYKLFAEFYGHPNSADGRASWCKACAIEHARVRDTARGRRQVARAAKGERIRQLNPAVERVHYSYSVSRAKAQELLARTQCACCGRRVSRADRTAHIDHDYLTGRVRGVLCPQCNTGIGQLGDDVAGLDRALRYLTAQVDVFDAAESAPSVLMVCVGCQQRGL